MWVVVMPLLAACSAEAGAVSSQEPQVVRVSGSGSATPIVEVLAEEFATSHPGVSFEFRSGTNTGGGVSGVSDGTLDVGVANRPLGPEEVALGVGYHPFALDAFVFAVRLPNDVTSLTTSQVRSLCTLTSSASRSNSTTERP